MHTPEEQPDDRSDDTPWRPDEQVGDIYEIDTELADSPETSDPDAPRIWVGSLADYNNGILHGDWIGANHDQTELHEQIKAILETSPWMAQSGDPAEEWGIFDYENFGALTVHQHDDLSWISAVARGIAEHGLAFAAWADVMEDEDALGGFEDAFLGHYDSLTAYGDQLVDDLGYQELIDQAVPESLRPYVRIDSQALANDLYLGGDIHPVHADGGGVWVFSSR
jgi:antirestriction protein